MSGNSVGIVQRVVRLCVVFVGIYFWGALVLTSTYYPYWSKQFYLNALGDGMLGALLILFWNVSRIKWVWWILFIVFCVFFLYILTALVVVIYWSSHPGVIEPHRLLIMLGVIFAQMVILLTICLKKGVKVER